MIHVVKAENVLALCLGALFLLACVSAAVAQVDISGDWIQTVDGARCRINVRDDAIYFANLTVSNINGKGHFRGHSSIGMETDFGGGSARITEDGNEIHWNNGIVWRRARTHSADHDSHQGGVNISGDWIQNVDGAPCRINVRDDAIYFANLSVSNINGKGHFRGPSTIVMETDFGGGSAKITNDGNEIHWNNGIVWQRRK
jgi:hypothetical protein